MLHAREDYNRIQDPEGKFGEDEPVFLLRAKDHHFVGMLEDYLARILTEKEPDHAIIAAVQLHIGRARLWQDKNTSKAPDMSPDDVVHRDRLVP